MRIGAAKLRVSLKTGVAVAGLLCGAGASPVRAQDGTAVELETIVVQAREQEDPVLPIDGYVARTSAGATKTGTPLLETQQSVSVVTSGEIEAQGAQTLGEALDYVPGVVSEPYGADPRFDSPIIRGFDGRQSQYLNGLKIMRGAGAPALEIYGLERVEVLKGPASVLYGQGNPGGLINMVSKHPVFERFGKVEVLAGDYEHLEGRFDIGGPIGKAGEFAYRFTGLARGAGEQTDYLENDRYFLAPAVTWKPGQDTTLTLLTSIQHDNPSSPSGLPPELTLYAGNKKLPRDFYVGDPDFDDSNRTLINLGFEFEHRLNDTWTISQNARYSNFDWDYQALGLSSRGLAPDGRTLYRSATYRDEDLNTYNADTNLKAEFATGAAEHTALLGVDVRYLDDSTLTQFGTVGSLDAFDPQYNISIPKNVWYESDYSGDLWQVGLYAQDEISLGNWRATFGLRQDWSAVESNTVYLTRSAEAEQYDNALTGRAGLSYLFDIGVAPYVSYATSFEPEIGQDANGNPLKPTTGEQVEVGIKYQPDWFNGFFSVAGYDLRQKNVLTTVVSGGVSSSAQIGEVHVQGIELEGVVSLVEGLDVRASYTHMNAEVVGGEDDGLRPDNVPENAAALWADYTFAEDTALAGFGAGAGVRYLGQRYGDADNELSIPAVTLVDASLHYEKNGFKASLNVKNLLDEDYIASCGTFGCYYGNGRTFMAGLSYSW